MIATTELIRYLDKQLKPHLFKDYCPNGLQVAGKKNIHHIVAAVTASQQAIAYAIQVGADALMVHHGYFWKGEEPTITGVKKNRLKALLQHDINLIAYHLPLDAHSEFGNNVLLAQKLDIQITNEQPVTNTADLVLTGQLATPLSGQAFAQKLKSTLDQMPLHIAGTTKDIHTIAWCSGAAQDYIENAAFANVDAYLTGEASERTYHLAKELGIHFYAAGHHATERYGIQALGQHLAEKYRLEYVFFDEDNPV